MFARRVGHSSLHASAEQITHAALVSVDDAGTNCTQALRKVFPPIVTGVTVFLIGAALVGTGFKYWGGGAFCGDNFADGILCR